MEVERCQDDAVAAIRAAMADSKAQLASVNSILVGFKGGLDRLEGQMMPIYSLTEKLRETQKNIDISVHELRAVNENFTTASDVATVLQQGAKYDQERYIKTMHKLLRSIEFLELHRGYEGSGKALDHARHVLTQAQAKCKSDFVSDVALVLRYSVSAQSLSASTLHDADVMKASKLLTCLLSTKLPPTALLVEYGERRLKLVTEALDKVKAKDDAGSQARIAEYLDNIVLAIHAEKELANRVFPNEDLAHAALSWTVAPLLESLTKDVKEEDAKDVFQPMELHYMFKSKSTSFRDVLQPPLRLREHPGSETTEPWKLVGIIGKIEEGLAATSRVKLGAFKEDIADSVLHDKLGLKDGNVHPISSHTMHFLRELSDHVVALECLLSTDQTSNVTYFVDSVLMKLLDALQAKASAAKARGDLKAIFLVNNTFYVASAMAQLAGDFASQSPVVTTAIQQTMQPKVAALGEKAMAGFVEASYDGFESIVADPKSTLQYKSNSAVLTLESGRLLKDKFARFNAALEEVHTHHKAFVVPDAELREKLTTMAAQRIVPGYRAFYDKYAGIQFSKKNMEKYVKYKPDTVQSMLSDLFQGDHA
ncbi:hypothetical protein SPRG_17745 [Saprolegnia parasitica CBS 223.65]|uniref:Exocyst subunit Exo70 family protein n=1 Tax=Saprolegnia parasitica (strain CBS 223.65) TaxID=695850 RepID=A0A067BQ26_SAPPC|nr:hypothetical protein SPRG_17745 [Saprolegnia parasitica CBS 223.65]KDO16767.1 hypothetical protein SPRG_17745 [Saprolegnia parasitica CBS 223.65]|eukprot:XP_012212526.1 hypothetical protein SPRG_17745 [Saprolegnia parasitica CBS 223.65]